MTVTVAYSFRYINKNYEHPEMVNKKSVDLFISIITSIIRGMGIIDGYKNLCSIRFEPIGIRSRNIYTLLIIRNKDGPLRHLPTPILRFTEDKS